MEQESIMDDENWCFYNGSFDGDFAYLEVLDLHYFF